MSLTATTLSVSGLAPEQTAAMLALMRAHYENVFAENFFADLRRKDYVILLQHDDQILGFSTQQLFEHQLGEKIVTVLFSGDTIIDKNHWGSLALPVAWGRLMLQILERQRGRELYWLLTSKGYKTYRFLPVFFKEFYPCHGRETPDFMQQLLHSLAARCFAGRFDAARGVLRADADGQRLINTVAPVDERKLRDPHIAYFARQNPRHADGDELVCLARFTPENLTAYIRRQL